MTEAALVSVIIPVYNGERYLGAALESVLTQTYRPVEIIVVDDGSTDNTAQVVQAFARRCTVPLRYFHQENQGPAVARNRGIAKAAGDWSAFLDQDDIWLPPKLERQLALLRQTSEAGYVLVLQQFFLDAGFPRPSWVRLELLDKPQPGFIPSCLVVRRSLWGEIGTFATDLVTSSDVDWFFRAHDARVPFVNVPEVLVRRRIHARNQSRFVQTTHREILAAARSSIRRKRAATE
jgi:glycosyltransferase involved in cell wall biosynthesis